MIAPDPEMAALIEAQRAPFADELEEVIGTTDTLLFRRGNFNGTWDDLICDALLSEREAEIALVPASAGAQACCRATKSPARTSSTRPQ